MPEAKKSVPRLGGLLPSSGQMSSAKSEATTVANFHCQIRGKLVAKVNAKSEANPEAAEAALKNEIRFLKNTCGAIY